MPGVVLSAPRQVFSFQPLIQQQKIVLKNSSVPYFPPEIIRIILSLLRDDRKTLAACALVNHTFNLHVTPILYHTVSFVFPIAFTSFASSLNGESYSSRLIRHLDLSGLTSMGLQKKVATPNVVTPDVLIKILRSCTMLEAFSISESLQSSITLEVLKVLVFECRNLKSLDFCALSGKDFDSAISSLAEVMGRVECIQDYDDDGVPTYSFQKTSNVLLLPHLKRLSLHECRTISEHYTLLTLLANSPNLTHLDLGGCAISDATLNLLATETNVTQTLIHLSLAKCKNISSEAIAYLVSKCKNLQVLNLYGGRDTVTAFNEYDLDIILTTSSAKNLKSLDIGSSRITPHTLYTIQENCHSLTHLGIAKACIQKTENLNNFLTSMPKLQYIDLKDIPCLTSLNIGFIINHSLRIVEISDSLSKKLGAVNINGWRTYGNYSKRCYYAKPLNGERPERVHPRKLDVVESGSSKMLQYYSFDL